MLLCELDEHPVYGFRTMFQKAEAFFEIGRGGFGVTLMEN